MQPQARIHIIVYGDVQGVFFRAGTVSEAKKLGLKGWVRNNPDGSVEMVAEGDKTALGRLLEWCAHGPAGASVSKVEHRWVDAAGEFADFVVRY
ncbi:MAG: acylphosphatase [Candidatus ainarchaeum sp.]|nr:acylphosphatase [Candidatus ainarchaeum sp.]